jgi:hypothetical protein
VVDEPQSPPAAYGAFFRAIEGLEARMREDNERLEARLMGVVVEIRSEQRESNLEHAKEHQSATLVAEAEHARFSEFIRNAEIAQARRDGALGVFRFVVEQVSRHWQPLSALLVTAGIAGLALGGNIHIEVGLR